MGLVINIEHWPMPAAIALATEGVRASYNQGCGGGGFGAADREIGAKLDGAKVLAVIDQMEITAQHLADWCLFAYASPLWNSTDNKTRFLETLMNDWAVLSFEQGTVIQKKTFERMSCIASIVAGAFALEQIQGVSIINTDRGLSYQPKLTRSYLIHLLVEHDIKNASESARDSEFESKRRRHYQTHWDAWHSNIEQMRTLLMNYDRSARILFKKTLEKQNGSY